MLEDKRLDGAASAEDIDKYLKALGITTLNDLYASMIRNLTVEIKLVPEAWKSFDNFLGIKESDWTKIKYYKDGKKNKELAKIPNDSGGIYVYYIQPEGVPVDNYHIIMYVGRAHYGKGTQNLRKRVSSYDGEANDIYKGRASIRYLFKRYREYLYVMYVPVDGNDNIDRLERELTVALDPPANSDLFHQSLKTERKMF